MLSDLAGIYTCSTPDSRIAHNVVHDVSRRDYGGWGIYPDEGSHDLLIQKNLVYRCQDGALFAHHNRNITAENNIFAFNRAAQVDRGGIGGFELTSGATLSITTKGKPSETTAAGIGAETSAPFERQPLLEYGQQTVILGGKDLAAWQAAGQDRNSRVADPLFVDPRERGLPTPTRLSCRADRLRVGDTASVGPRSGPVRPK